MLRVPNETKKDLDRIRTFTGFLPPKEGTLTRGIRKTVLVWGNPRLIGGRQFASQAAAGLCPKEITVTKLLFSIEHFRKIFYFSRTTSSSAVIDVYKAS